MTVITISSVVNGLNQSVSGLVQSLGSNVRFIFRFPAFSGRPTTEMLSRKQLTYDDSQAMRLLPRVVALSCGAAVCSNAPGRAGVTSIKGGGKTMQNDLTGVAPEQQEVHDLAMADGRFFNGTDEERAAKVTVLGFDTAQQLFSRDDSDRARRGSGRDVVHCGGSAGRSRSRRLGGGY